MSKITHEQALRFNEKAMQINKIVFSIPGDNTVEKLNTINDEGKKGIFIILDHLLTITAESPIINDNEKSFIMGNISAILDVLDIKIDEDVRLAALEDAIANQDI